MKFGVKRVPQIMYIQYSIELIGWGGAADPCEDVTSGHPPCLQSISEVLLTTDVW